MKTLFQSLNKGLLIIIFWFIQRDKHFRKKLLPKPSDLSYYNWETQLSTSNSTPLYQVIADSAQGLLFKNKRDRKIVNVNPESEPGDNTTRTELHTKEYIQVVFYDHSTRRRL